MSAVLLEFGVCQGDSKLSEQIQKKHLSSEAVKLAIYAKSVLSTFIDQLNETYCVNTNFDEQLYACVDGVTIQLSDLLEHAATFASNPAGVTPPPGWDPAAKKAVVHLRLKKPIRRRQKKAQSVAAAAADTGDPTAPPSAPTPSSKVVTATDVFSKLTELIVTTFRRNKAGLFYLPSAKEFFMPAALYAIGTAFELYPASLLKIVTTYKDKTTTIFEHLRKKASAANLAMLQISDAAALRERKKLATAWDAEFGRYLPDATPPQMLAVISKHRAAIAEQLPAKRRPVLQKMFEPGSDKGVGDAENEAENDDDDDADDEESAEDHLETGSKTAVPGTAADKTAGQGDEAVGGSSVTPLPQFSSAAKAALNRRNAPDQSAHDAEEDDGGADEEADDGEADEEADDVAPPPRKKTRGTGPAPKPSRHATAKTQDQKDNEASSPSAAARPAKPRAAGKGKGKAAVARLVDDQAAVGK